MATISVVTICFNNLNELKLTCLSVDKQSKHPDEHLIVNGSNTSEIYDWLLNNKQPKYRRWINVENKHIAGNFNHGIENASFQFIHLLNSGDEYVDEEVLSDVYTFLGEHPEANWISGKINTIRGGILVSVGKPFEKANFIEACEVFFIQAGL
ncbi:MAG: glycosyltransferase [Saprospiraceae bacterium]|nr:glycosyltransferase [Saprospiraceae bacterium]